MAVGIFVISIEALLVSARLHRDKKNFTNQFKP